MNKNLVVKFIKPHLNSKKELTYSDFDGIFSTLENQEKYLVCDFLNELGIELVDEKSVNDSFIEDFPDYNPETTPKKFIVKKENNNNIPLGVKNWKNLKKSFEKYKYESNEFLLSLYQRTQSKEILSALIQKNQRLIFKYANIFSHFFNHDLSDDDLIQIATIGFIDGCKRFDLNRGANLSTYVVIWIMQYLRRYIMNTGFIVRLPVHRWESLIKVNKILSKYSQDDDIESIIAENGLSKEFIDYIISLKHNYINPIYLDSHLDSDNKTTYLDNLSEHANCLISKISSPFEEIEFEFLKEDLSDVLSSLSLRERDVIKLRFGLDDDRPRTLEEIGQLFGVTRERIRQIEGKAFRRLRHPNRSKRLMSYLDNVYPEQPHINSSYFFKNSEGVSYIPDLSQIINRVFKLHPKQTDAEVLYNKVCACACQNSYQAKSLSKDSIIKKINKHLEERI